MKKVMILKKCDKCKYVTYYLWGSFNYGCKTVRGCKLHMEKRPCNNYMPSEERC